MSEVPSTVLSARIKASSVAIQALADELALSAYDVEEARNLANEIITEATFINQRLDLAGQEEEQAE